MTDAVILSHWLAATLLALMATWAWREAKSEALISKTLFLWPAAGFACGLVLIFAPLTPDYSQERALDLATGILLVACSLQAFLANIGKMPRWPSGAIWLSFIFAGIAYQMPVSLRQEPDFHDFARRLSGLVWAATGIMKVASQRSASHEGGAPAWILLLYLQAALIASHVR